VSSTRRHTLGSWAFPSGNHVDVYVEGDDGGRERRATCEWDSPPPLSVADESYYLVIVLPALTRRAQEYLERPGQAMVLFT
jgi:hypothetical protein